MSKKRWPEGYEGKRAGFVYLATNPAIPGLVKAGRTQGWPEERVKGLYATGVPEPFRCVASRFFVDCYTAEAEVMNALAATGNRCSNREFFRIQEKTARAILDNHYRRQSELVEIPERFYIEVQEAFKRAVTAKYSEWPELIVDCLVCLPHRKRELALLDMLAALLSTENEKYAIWLIRERGVDPEIPLDLSDHNKGVDLYYLNAHETSILLGLPKLEKYLDNIGCDVRQSNALCWVIDCLVNDTNKNDEWKCRLVRFGIDLLERGADVQKTLNVSLFADAPRRYRDRFRYDVFPRNSGRTCEEAVSMLAPRDQYLATLHEAITRIATDVSLKIVSS